MRERYSVERPDELTGYAVGYDEHCTDAGEPVWYGGGKLAPDLSLPRLHARWRAVRAPLPLPGPFQGHRKALSRQLRGLGRDRARN